MATQEPYNKKTLNIRAAEFYKSIRKEKSKWKSIVDLAPMLAEFKHYIAAGEYVMAFDVYDSISGSLINWSENLRLIEMGETLFEKDPFGELLPDVIVMKIKTYISWGCLFSNQLDKGEKAALEAKTIGEKLLAKGSSADSYSSVLECMTVIFNIYAAFFVFTGRNERSFEVLRESEEKLKILDDPSYKASYNTWHGWALQEMGDRGALGKLFAAGKLFDEIDETELNVFLLGEKERCMFDISKEYAKLGQTEAGYDAYSESRRIHEIINDDLFPMLLPNYGGPSVRYSYKFGKSENIGKEGVAVAEKSENLYHLEKNIVYVGNLMRDKGVWNIFVDKPEEKEEKHPEYQKRAFSFFQSAIDNFQNAAEMANTLGIAADVAMLHGKIGNCYCHLGHGDPGLFILAEENLKKTLDLAQSDATKYGAYLDLGRLYVFNASKIYKESSGQRKQDAINKVNQANEHFTRVYEDATRKDEPVYGAKAAYGLGVAALETALVEELEGDAKKQKFEEARKRFQEAEGLFKNCAAQTEKNKFLSGQEAEDFRKKYGKEPINLRELAEMKYEQATAVVGVLVCVDEYVSDDETEEHYTDEARQAYEEAFNQVPNSLDFLRDAYRDLNMLRVSLDKEENRAQKAMDDGRKEIIKTWLEKNKGIDEKHDETAKLNWGFPISKKVIEKFFAQ